MERVRRGRKAVFGSQFWGGLQGPPLVFDRGCVLNGCLLAARWSLADVLGLSARDLHVSDKLHWSESIFCEATPVGFGDGLGLRGACFDLDRGSPLSRPAHVGIC